MHQCKIVGKTTFMNRYFTGIFKEYTPRVGVEEYSIVEFDNTTYAKTHHVCQYYSSKGGGRWMYICIIK